MFDFERKTLFCLEKRYSKHKMTIFSKNLGGMVPLPPLATPMHISNDKSLITSTRIFHKSSSASLDCISISELCSAINTTVATVHENFTSQN